MGQEFSPTSRRFNTVGLCIYCGSDTDLTDEHIIPEGMGGREILPKSSCRPCATITGRFEQAVMRQTIWPLRLGLKMGGKKRKRPTKIPIRGIDKFGKEFTATEEHSGIGFKGILPVFHKPPGFFTGELPTDELGVDFDIFFDRENMKEFHAPGSYMDIRPEWYAFMLAKMAHSHAVAHIGIGNFEPFLPAVILGNNSLWPYLIGRAEEESPGPQQVGHWINLYRQREPHEGILLSRIRLFAELNGPTYDIVVGRTR